MQTAWVIFVGREVVVGPYKVKMEVRVGKSKPIDVHKKGTGF